MKQVCLIILIVIIVCVSIFYTCSNRAGYPDKIRKWGEEKHIEIKSMDERRWDCGPYSRWKTKNRTIYRVETNDGVYWFRFQNLSSEIDEVEKE